VGYIKTLFSRDGKFRKEAYDNFLRMLYTAPRLRYRADQFEEFLKEELLIAKIHERIFKDLPASQPVSPKADRNGQGQEPAEAQKDPVTKRLDHYLSFLQKTAEELKVKVYLPTK
jgi:hypothetical protein